MASKKTTQFSAVVIKRFMSDKDFESFIQEYNDNRLNSKSIRKPSDKDLRIASLLRKEQSYSKVANMVGISTFAVLAATGRVAAYKN